MTNTQIPFDKHGETMKHETTSSSTQTLYQIASVVPSELSQVFDIPQTIVVLSCGIREEPLIPKENLTCRLGVVGTATPDALFDAVNQAFTKEEANVLKQVFHSNWAVDLMVQPIDIPLTPAFAQRCVEIAQWRSFRLWKSSDAPIPYPIFGTLAPIDFLARQTLSFGHMPPPELSAYEASKSFSKKIRRGSCEVS